MITSFHILSFSAPYSQLLRNLMLRYLNINEKQPIYNQTLNQLMSPCFLKIYGDWSTHDP